MQSIQKALLCCALLLSATTVSPVLANSASAEPTEAAKKETETPKDTEKKAEDSADKAVASNDAGSEAESTPPAPIEETNDEKPEGDEKGEGESDSKANSDSKAKKSKVNKKKKSKNALKAGAGKLRQKIRNIKAIDACKQQEVSNAENLQNNIKAQNTSDAPIGPVGTPPSQSCSDKKAPACPKNRDDASPCNTGCSAAA